MSRAAAVGPAGERAVPSRTAAAPAPFDAAFLVVLLMALSGAAAMLNADGDLARHLRLGEFILDRGTLPDRDLFSFTVAGRRFVPYEWLAEVTFAAAYRAAGLPGVAALAATLIALAHALVAAVLRARGVDPLLALVTALVGAAAATTHWLARPHLFTFLGAVLTFALAERADGRRWWLAAPLFAVWANLHGGFLFGLILLALYAAGDAAELLVCRGGPEWRARLRFHLAALGAGAAACLVNPAGPALYPHVVGYLGERFLLATTVEYRSPDFHTGTGRFFLLTILALVGGLALGQRRPSLPRLLVLEACLAFALHSARNIPLFALAALPAAALELDPAWRRIGVLARVRAVVAGAADRTRAGAWAASGVLAAAVLAASGGGVSGRQLLPDRFDPARFPVQAVARARAAGLEGRIFHEFAWGGYLLHAWPEQPVFIDGQTDLYGEELARQYLQVATLAPGWRAVLDEWRIALVLVPTRSRLAAELARDGGWSIWYCDRTAVLFRRKGRGAATPGRCPAGPDGCRCEEGL